jgi:hypothetical protein
MPFFMLKRKGDLEIEEDFKTQKRMWVFQDFGNILMLLIVLASVLGFLSPGIFSKIEEGSPDDLKVKYDRTLHYSTVTQMKIEVAPTLVQNGRGSFDFERRYIEDLDIERIVPEPERVKVLNDRYRYIFAVEQSDQPFTVVFHVKPKTRGSIRGRLQSETGKPIAVSQFVFP